MPAPLIVGPSTTATGTSRVQYRRLLAEQLGEIAVLQTTSEPLTATSADAARQIVCTSLFSDAFDTGYFDDAYVYVVNGAQAGQVRKVLSGTFDGPIGSLLLDKEFSATLDAGTEIELTRPLPSDRHLTTKGLNQIVNEALQRCWIPVRLALTGTGTYAQGLDAYPWFERYEQGRGLYDETWVGNLTGEPELSPYGYRLVEDGAGRTLVTEQPYATAESYQLAAIVDGDRYVYDGTAWGFSVSSPGLLTDAYQGAAPRRWVVSIGMVKALQERAKQVTHSPRMAKEEKAVLLADNLAQRRIWAPAAARIRRVEMPRPVPERTAGLVYARSADDWI